MKEKVNKKNLKLLMEFEKKYAKSKPDIKKNTNAKGSTRPIK